MTKQDVNRGDIALCAALGSAIAGVALGIVASISLLGAYASLSDAAFMLMVSVPVGTAFAVFIGTPIGLGVGFIVSRWIGTGIGHAALAGALTGIAYPLFMLVAGILMDANGLAALTGSFVLFGAVGAACGVGAYWLVIGRKRQRG